MGSVNLAADDALGRAQRGEAEAFTAIVDAHHAEMVRVAYVISGDVEVARDAVQAAWIKAWRQLPALREPSRLRSWLIAIAGNEARQAMRARRRRVVREVTMPETGATDDLVVDAPRSEPTDLVHALQRLDPLDRQLLAMCYLAGLSSEEIARATGRSASDVRARLSRLLSRLREDLSDA